MTQPKLGHRATNAYNRLARECAALNYVLRNTSQKGPVDWQTLLALNGMIKIANRLFRRHADLPRFVSVTISDPMSQADLAVFVSRLTAACMHFEEHYVDAGQTGIGRHFAAVEKTSYRR